MKNRHDEEIRKIRKARREFKLLEHEHEYKTVYRNFDRCGGLLQECDICDWRRKVSGNRGR
jgi:hypothetical protein